MLSDFQMAAQNLGIDIDLLLTPVNPQNPEYVEQLRRMALKMLETMYSLNI